MILSVFITVISGHDKPQPPGCLLGELVFRSLC
ncbi:hemolysin activation protein [Salmonella enterica subsp. enterica serovar Virchow]|nr:hemolysin activation protein [Escherichia coli]EBW3042407.1 hemolysin activation protein [Salmonella enterica subsp. enterica serovar Virchow]EFW2042805.1 hemolysin activation protein [Shigella flexneri]EAB6865028.1 hemolysin activation protein [Escherichia coli]EBW3528407.1 hemolysin activation protein [Salmonella enterica subsp. enterica serovar Virchow]